ncbi:major capsid protein [Turicibacter sanguinis]|uniref:major capsid protein n=1 Tax=Turicibacter sanguinis TaxID=154288 RepID=UPI0018AA1FB7|nr:phage capsid protein [Turicibacter sanguinis]MDB8553258.1 phage capsid protein [Turicibacter sanguinis]
MAITLAEAQKNVQDDLQMGVIDEFRKSSFILDHLPFDDCVSPTGGGATLTYGYTRLITQPTSGFRNVNEEYTPSSVTKQRYTVDLKIFGGSFEVDRVIAKMGGIIDEVDLQIKQKVKSARALFNDTFINGDSGVDEKSFDGLEKALAGSSTEFNNGDNIIDLSTSAKVTENYMAFLDMLDEFLATLDGEPTFIGGNSKLIAKIRACARRAGMYQTKLNDFGTQVEFYGTIPLVDLGTKPGSNEDVVATAVDGTTSLYAARLAMDGLHGISMAGDAPINVWLPNFKEAGAVKKGEVEMIAGIALKASKAAGVFRKIKVK